MKAQLMTGRLEEYLVPPQERKESTVRPCLVYLLGRCYYIAILPPGPLLALPLSRSVKNTKRLTPDKSPETHARSCLFMLTLRGEVVTSCHAMLEYVSMPLQKRRDPDGQLVTTIIFSSSNPVVDFDVASTQSPRMESSSGAALFAPASSSSLSGSSIGSSTSSR